MAVDPPKVDGEKVGKSYPQWRRGLFRIWIVLSIIWSVPLFLLYLSAGEEHWPLGWLVVLMPWFLTGIGFGIRWIIRGFRT